MRRCNDGSGGRTNGLLATVIIVAVHSCQQFHAARETMKRLNLTGWGVFAHPDGGGPVARVLTENDLVPAAVAAGRLRIRSQRLHAWRTVGWIDPATGQRLFLRVAEHTDTGRPLYRLGDVEKAERDTHLNPRSHRLPLAV